MFEEHFCFVAYAKHFVHKTDGRADGQAFRFCSRHSNILHTGSRNTQNKAAPLFCAVNNPLALTWSTERAPSSPDFNWKERASKRETQRQKTRYHKGESTWNQEDEPRANGKFSKPFEGPCKEEQRSKHLLWLFLFSLFFYYFIYFKLFHQFFFVGGFFMK